ncbi:type VII secretion target [Rhodococcus tibetensis]|uniref:ESX-1 secretion-associated protein n=1 Tax=Rhodococcus tibetensis TaxID=2965064 RepID=A0ABT1QHB1_9NOCA|nr:type VII secretion target [Rhodococcus sp. FXJ9.536]MCQ4121671.1 ESX-1 secretion-associated protein [Rhodococcus sp. FXJ9.536]
MIVDIVELRVAAGQMDGVFAEVNTALTPIDGVIARSSAAWASASGAAFIRFGAYLDARREALLGDIARIADNLAGTADRYDRQDTANTDAVAHVLS